MKRQTTWALVILGSIAAVALLGWGATRSGRAEEGPPILQSPSFPPTPTIGAPPAAAPGLAGSGLAADSFDSGNSLAQWQVIDQEGALPEQRANWNVQDGALVQNGVGQLNDPVAQDTMAVIGDANWADYVVQAKVYDQNNGMFGLVARQQGNSFYRYRILADRIDATPKQVLEKVIDGVATPLVTLDSPGYKARAWHVIAMQVSGTQIRVTIDGKLVAEATDSALTHGKAGLYTLAVGGIRFDDVSIGAP